MDIDFKEFRKRFKEHNKVIEDEFDIELSIGRITYDTWTFRTKLEAKTKESAPATIRDYELNEALFGLPPLGSRFKIKDTTYKTVGFNTKARKNKILIVDINTGKEYICPVSLVINAYRTSPIQRAL